MVPKSSRNPLVGFSALRQPSRVPCSLRLLLAQSPQPPGPWLGLLLPAPVPVAPAVHLVAGAAWTRHLRYLILPLRLQPSPCPPAPLSSVGLTSPRPANPGLTAPQQWGGGCHRAPTASPHLAAAPRLPRGPDVAPPPTPLSLHWVHPGLHPHSLPHPSICPDRMRARLRAVKYPQLGPLGFRVTTLPFPSRIWKPSPSA